MSGPYPGRTEIRADARAFAEAMSIYRYELREVGFDDKEALRLMLAMLGSMGGN